MHKITFLNLFLLISMNLFGSVCFAQAEGSPPSPTPEYRAASRNFIFSVTPALMVSGSINFASVTGIDSGNAFTGNIQYNLGTGFSLKGEYAQRDPESFNFGFGLGLESSRNLDRVEGRFSNGTLIGTAGGKVQSFYGVGTVNYLWEIFYLGGGFLLGSVQTSDTPAALKDLKGTIGFEFTLGWLLNDRVAIDLTSRAIAVNGNKLISNGDQIDLGIGTVQSLNLGAKIFFP